jgi:hypothetical protein
MIRRLRLAAIALVATALLTACNIVTHVVVHPDGSGTYALVLTAPASATGNAGPAIVAGLKKATAASDVPLQVKPISVGGESGAEASFVFRSLPDLKAESARLASAGGGLNAVTVDRTSTGWHFTSATVPGLKVPPVGQGSTGGSIDAVPLTGIVHVSIVVTLPGAPGVNNATAVTHDASTSTFDWTVTVGQAVANLQASTTLVGNQGAVKLASALTPVHSAAVHHASSHGWIVVLVVILLVLLLGVAAVVLLRRRSGDAPADLDPEPEPVDAPL